MPEEIQQEQKDIKENNNSQKEAINSSKESENNDNNEQGNKVKEALENKFKGEENQGKRDELNTLFQSIGDNFDEKIVITYIENINNMKLLSFLRKPAEVRQKYLIDEIDKQNNNIEYNKVVNKESEVVNKESEVVNKESEVVKEKFETIDTNKNFEETKEMAKALTEARDNFKKIPDEDKIDGKLEEQNEDTQKLINQKVDKINQSNPENPITADEFFNMQLTAQKYKSEGKSNKFLESFEKLDRLTDSKPIGTLKSSEGADKAIKYSKPLNDYKETIDVGGNTPSTKEYESKRKEFTDLENPDKINKQYEDKDNQILIKKYKILLPTEPEEDTNQSKEQNDQQLLQRKKDTIIQANDIAQQSKDILQKRILGSAISGLAGYFDFSTTQQESISKDFKIEDGFDIDQNIFSLKGNINGKEIEMQYDLGNGKLSMEDYLFQEKNENVMRIGQNKFQDLKIQLPPIATLTKQAKVIRDEDISGDTTEKYLENLEANLDQTLNSNFNKNQEIVKVRIERAVQKNVAVQETIKNFNQIISPEGKNIFANKEFSKDLTEKYLFKTIKLIDNSLEKYSISDIEQRRANMPVLKDFIINNRDSRGTTDNTIKNTFNKMFNKDQKETNEEGQERRTKNLYKTLKSLSEKNNGIRTINIESLSKSINELKKAEPDIKKTSPIFAESISKDQDASRIKELESEINEE